jgi:opacity protein-like surface antigen
MTSPNTLALHMNKTRATALVLAAAALLAAGCTQERQNQIKRDIQNWTGTDGVLEIYSGNQVAKRFLKIDKLSTALGTDDKQPRAYRFGYGVLDANLNGVVDEGEKRVYFEVSDYSTYVFFENPR